MLGISVSNLCVNGFRGGIDADAKAIYNRIIAIPNGFSNLSRLNYFVKGLKAIYGTLSNVPVCYDAHWIGGVLGGGVGATAGQACARLCSLTVAGDAIQATASAQPLLLMHGGASSDNYYQSIVGGGYCQTLTNVSPQINTDFTFEFNFKNLTEVGILGGCPAASANGWSLQIQTGINALRFYGRNSTVNVVSLISTSGITIVGNRWVKVVRSGNDYSFWEKADGGTYTQVGTTITNSTVLNSYTLPIQVCNGFTPNFVGISCAILKANFYSDATATNLVVDFNPAQYNASTSQTQWTSSTGEVWTINTGTATTGYKGVICDRIIVMSDGVDDFIRSSTLTSKTLYTRYLAIKSLVSVSQYIFAGNGASNHLTYKKPTNIISIYNAPVEIITTNVIPVNTYLITIDINAALSKIKSNNNSYTTGNLPVTPTNQVTFGADGVGASYSNVILNTAIETSNVDSDATKTATYNFIRSLNNNAF